MRSRWTVTIVAAFLLMAGLAVSLPGGKAVFEQERCLGCHRFKGAGGMIGPDLTDISKRRSLFWIASQIRDPKQHNPDSRMPSFAHLSFPERCAIALYLGY